jgi:hypothetical protein
MLSTQPSRKLQNQTKKGKRRPSKRIMVILDLLPDVYKRVVSVQHTRELLSVQDVFVDGFRLIEYITKEQAEGWDASIRLDNGVVIRQTENLSATKLRVIKH